MPNYKRQPLDDRFWGRLVKTESGCWLWPGGVAGQMGYGVISYQGKSDYTHRVAYRVCKGPIPPRMLVMHSCDTPRCCNPEHLSVGTHRQNTDNALSKNRMARGSKAGPAKLKENQVIEIKKRLLTGETHESISADYPVNRSVISRIRSGVIWGHLSISEGATL